jgi:hypothetical protein
MTKDEKSRTPDIVDAIRKRNGLDAITVPQPTRACRTSMVDSKAAWRKCDMTRRVTVASMFRGRRRFVTCLAKYDEPYVTVVRAAAARADR